VDFKFREISFGEIAQQGEIETKTGLPQYVKKNWPELAVTVPDHESQDHDVVLVRRTIHLGKPRGVGKLKWGGNGEGTGRGRSVYEQPRAKVDGIAPPKGGIPSK
jgi:hypothetical protein